MMMAVTTTAINFDFCATGRFLELEWARGVVPLQENF